MSDLSKMGSKDYGGQPPNISNDLKDKCAAVQLKLRIDDQRWREMFGNDSGLYGLVTAYTQQECLKSRIDELTRLIMDRQYIKDRKWHLREKLNHGVEI